MSAQFNISLDNPFAKRTHKNREIFYNEYSISKNKTIDIQFDGFDPRLLVGISFLWLDKHCDHKGLTFDLTLLGFFFAITFRDNRHSEDY